MSTWSKFFYSKWFILIGSSVVVFLLVSVGRSYYEQNKIRQEIMHLQEETKQLESKKLETIALLQYVHSPTFIEEKARTELNLIKPGEQVSIIKNPRKNSADRQNIAVMVPSSRSSNPEKWFNYFFGHNNNTTHLN